jgi:hypothetical protein
METPTPETSPEDRSIRAALARELYWAENATSRSHSNIAQIRYGLRDFVSTMRTDQRLAMPRGEPNVTDPAPWRRRIKFGMFRFLRPVSKRYDRLLADLAELNAGLADRVAELEATVARLQERVGDGE